MSTDSQSSENPNGISFAICPNKDDSQSINSESELEGESMDRQQGWIALVFLFLITVFTAVGTLPVIQPYEAKLPKRDKVIETPVPEPDKVGIFVSSDGGTNSNYFTPDSSGVVKATMPGPNGEQIEIVSDTQQNEIHVNIVSPGAHPGPDPTQ